MIATGRSDRVALIGPILPYRGGIAQHTTRLHRTLSERCNLLTISYSRQYPSWLFPGESDREPGCADYSEPSVEYLIDSVNPLTWHRAVKRVLEHRAQTILIPWWTVFWAPLCWYLATALTKEGRTIVFQCHNVTDHEAASWKVALTRLALCRANRFVTHTHAERERLLHLFPRADVDVSPLPLFDQFPDPPAARLPRRAGTELLFYGFVRPYKGLPVLLDAMKILESRDIHLTIAGEFWDGLEKTRARIGELGIASRVELIPGYIPELQSAALFDRADVVVLPYLSATGSGVVPLAYRYGKPVISSRVGGLPEVVAEGKSGLLVPAGDAVLLAAAIERFMDADRATFHEGVAAERSKFTWERLEQTLLEPRSQTPPSTTRSS